MLKTWGMHEGTFWLLKGEAKRRKLTMAGAVDVAVGLLVKEGADETGSPNRDHDAGVGDGSDD